MWIWGFWAVALPQSERVVALHLGGRVPNQEGPVGHVSELIVHLLPEGSSRERSYTCSQTTWSRNTCACVTWICHPSTTRPPAASLLHLHPWHRCCCPPPHRPRRTAGALPALEEELHKERKSQHRHAETWAEAFTGFILHHRIIPLVL